jgi:hypothetical protein
MSRIVFLLEFNVSRGGENPKKNHRKNRYINREVSNEAAAPKSLATIRGRDLAD